MPKNEKDILEQVIFAKDLNQTVKLFDGMPENERRKLAPRFLKQLKDFDRPEKLHQFLSQLPDEFIAEGPAPNKQGLNQKLQTAIIATADIKEIKQMFRANTWGLRMIDDYVEPILRERKPDWLPEFFIWSCEFTDNTFWPIYRRLCLEGIVDRILHDTVIRAMFTYLLHDYIYHDNYDPTKKPTSIVPLLENNADLLDHELWRLFEFTSFPSNWSLTSWDKENFWKNAIVFFIEKGKIDKQRVLDGCFSCLDKPFTEQQAKWYAQLLEQISWTDDELQRDQKRFLALLDNSNSTPRTLGLKIAERLFKSERLNDTLLIKYVPSVLRDPSKGKAKKGITLLDKLAKCNPSLRNEIFQLLLEGLQHESTDVQNAALAVLTKNGGTHDPMVMDSIRQIADLLSPSVRVELNLDATGINVKEKNSLEFPPVFGSTQATPIPLASVQSIDELFDLAAHIIEAGGSAEEGEQLLDGISRLCFERPTNWEMRIRPLLKRIEHIHLTFPSFGREAYFPILDVIKEWLQSDSPEKSRPRYAILRNPLNPEWIFRNRCNDIAANIRNGISCQLLSFPSHHGYAVSTSALLDRIARNRHHFDSVSIFDQIQAMFRLAPEDMASMLVSLGEKDFTPTKADQTAYREFYHVLRYVTGGPEIPEEVSSDFRELGIQIRSLQGNVPRYEFAVRDAPQGIWKRVGPMFSVSSLETERIPGLNIWNSLKAPDHTESRQLLYEHLATICPFNMEPYYAYGCTALGMDVNTKSRMAENAVFLRALVASSNPLGQAGSALVLIAMVSQAPTTQQLGVDAFIQGIASERLDSKQSIETFASLLPLKVFKPIRWVKTLGICAEESNLHARCVHQLIEETLPYLPANELPSFLALLWELSLSTGRKISVASSRLYLKTITSGKAAKLAKKLLEL